MGKRPFQQENRIATSGHFMSLLAMTLYGFNFTMRRSGEVEAKP